MLITRPSQNLVEMVESALTGGVTMVQLRDKKASDSDVFDMANRLLPLTTAHDVPLIINDRLPIAKRLGIGLHVGMSDVSPREARQVLGKKPILGLTVHDRIDLIASAHDWIDYVGCGPVYATSTKSDARAIIGIDGLRKVCAGSSKPVIAIGGIDTENVGPVWQSGVSGVAVCAAICSAMNPQKASRLLAQTASQND